MCGEWRLIIVGVIAISTVANAWAVETPPLDPATRSSIIVRKNNLQTSAGPTAQTLKAKQFEIFTEFRPMAYRLSESYTPTGVRYGIFDQWTIALATTSVIRPDERYDSRLVIAESQLNFLNLGNWAFAFRNSVGYDVGHDSSHPGYRHTPILSEVVSSHEVSDEQSIHLSFGGGRNFKVDEYDNAREKTFIGRFTLAFETRVSRYSAFTFSVAPELEFERYTHQSMIFGNVSNSSSLDRDYRLMFGSGYNFSGRRFGFHVGLELGPSWNNSYYNDWHYQSNDVEGRMSVGFNFRI